ncbi:MULTISPECIES: twin-arginine translocation pathway signal protein [unclassified Pseudomonas]|uniref:twin-arginine translocation pathway signal protein n=1 Tax=unclassified Pseudomonas TaxID=196821 RepID=UPI00131BE66A|nr:MULTISPECIES: twin-arginine translocation pathway signal protein [unclassified Pseudomonas]
MPHLNRRQTLGLLAASAALPLLGGYPLRAFAAGAEYLALVEKEAPGIGFYRLADGKRVGSLELPEQPHEIVADRQGRYAYVGQYGVKSWQAPGEGGHQVSVIDLAERRLVRSIDLSPYHRLHGMRLDDQGRLYVLSETDSLLIRFDRPATAESPSQIVPVGGTRSHYFVLTRDGRRAYVADTLSGLVILVDAHNPAVLPVKKYLGQAPEGCCLSPDERTFYVLDRFAGILHALDARDLAPIRQIKLRGEAVRVAALPDGRLLVSNLADKSLSLLRPDTLAEVAYLPMDSAVPGLNLDPRGEWLFAALEDNQLAVVDLRNWREIRRFATGKAPDTAVVFQA